MVWQFWGRAARDVLSLTAQDVFYCPRAARLRGSHKVGFPQMSLELFIASNLFIGSALFSLEHRGSG